MLRSYRFLSFVLLWALPVFAGETESYSLNQYLNVQWARGADFAAQSQDVLFTTNITGVSQLWSVTAKGGWPTQITFEEDGVSSGVCSPTDQNMLLVSADRGGNERKQLYFVDIRGGVWERLTKDDNAIYRFGGWTRDGRKIAYTSNERDPSVFDTYVLDVATRKATMIHKGDGWWVASGWSPDGRYLALEKLYSNSNSDLFLYDTLSAAIRLMTPHEGDALFSSPRWIPDSNAFYFRTNLGRDFIGLAKMEADSAKLEWIETPDWNIEMADVSRDGQYRVWVVNVDGYSEFHLLNILTGKHIRPYRLPKGIIRNVKFSPDSRWLFVTFTPGKAPENVYVYLIAKDWFSPITHVAAGGVNPETFIAPELVHYETFDGRQIPAFLYKPKHVKGKMPVIYYVHGGPESQARPKFRGLFQYFLNRGYAVFMPNVRGSTGYGRTYMQMDNVAGRMDGIKDVEYGARWLASQKDVDAKKLIIYGGSYGGFSVLSSMVTYPKRWAAGVDVVGISNFVTFLENTGPWRRAMREAEYGTLANDREFLKEISPITHIDKIQAPLFIIQGANDSRVPKTESDQIYEAVKTRGLPVEYILFEDEGHGVKKLPNKIHAYTKMLEFLDKHVLEK